MPLSWWIIHQWMQGYAFRAPLNWWLLVLPIPVLLVITIGATSWLSWRAARVNPVDSLRSE